MIEMPMRVCAIFHLYERVFNVTASSDLSTCQMARSSCPLLAACRLSMSVTHEYYNGGRIDHYDLHSS